MASSSGIAMNIHYCMGKKKWVDFFTVKENKKCGKCGMKQKKGCCTDEHKFYKLEDSHKNVFNDIDFTVTADIAVVTHSLYNWQTPTANVPASIHNNSPPGSAKPSLCVLHCVFRL